MSPPMTARMAEHVRSRKPIALLAAIEHPSGNAYFWTGAGPLMWNGQKWTGCGQLGSVTPIEHTSDILVQDVQFQMTGVDPAIAATLDDQVRNLSGKLWLAGIRPGPTVVADPYQIMDAVLDYQALSASPDGTVTIAITAHTGFYTLSRALDEAWTTEDQHLTYPGDSGLDLIPGLQNQDLQWTPS